MDVNIVHVPAAASASQLAGCRTPAPNLTLDHCTGLESEEFYKHEALANGMGLFLQKTNIIRDYLVGGWVGSKYVW